MERHLPELPLIDRVKIQAEVLVPVLKALEAELGVDEAHRLVRAALSAEWRAYARRLAAAHGGSVGALMAHSEDSARAIRSRSTGTNSPNSPPAWTSPRAPMPASIATNSAHPSSVICWCARTTTGSSRVSATSSSNVTTRSCRAPNVATSATDSRRPRRQVPTSTPRALHRHLHELRHIKYASPSCEPPNVRFSYWLPTSTRTILMLWGQTGVSVAYDSLSVRSRNGTAVGREK